MDEDDLRDVVARQESDLGDAAYIRDLMGAADDDLLPFADWPIRPEEEGGLWDGASCRYCDRPLDPANNSSFCDACLEQPCLHCSHPGTAHDALLGPCRADCEGDPDLVCDCPHFWPDYPDPFEGYETPMSGDAHYWR